MSSLCAPVENRTNERAVDSLEIVHWQATILKHSESIQSPVGPLDNRVAMGSPRKVLRDIDPKKLEAGYTLDKGTTYCDGLPTATVISKKVNR